jgi:hypothetical protein
VSELNAHLSISIIIWVHPHGVALVVLEEEQELGAMGQERRTFLRGTVELRIVETVKMIRKVCKFWE